MQEELLARIQTAITELDEQSLTEFTKKAIEAGVDPATLIEKHIQQVSKGQVSYSTPDSISYRNQNSEQKIVAEVIKKVKKLIPQGQGINKGKVGIATIKGDIHDIGKNLIIM